MKAARQTGVRCMSCQHENLLATTVGPATVYVCVACDLGPDDASWTLPAPFINDDGTVNDGPVTHCRCGSRLTLADYGTVCRQCSAEGSM